MSPDRVRLGEVADVPVQRYAVTAVVPVKPLALAKSRLALPVEQRWALALAFALDTVAALSGSPCVGAIVVVTADPDVERCLQGQPAHLVRDTGVGLLPAVAAGCRVAASRWPGAGVAVVPADLPCLSCDDVTQVLHLAQRAEGAFVPDRATTGTTFVVTAPGRPMVARYGPGSAAKHLALGLRSLHGAPAGARHDVDTLTDLRAAAAFGLGAYTAAQVAALDRFGPPASLTA